MGDIVQRDRRWIIKDDERTRVRRFSAHLTLNISPGVSYEVFRKEYYSDESLYPQITKHLKSMPGVKWVEQEISYRPVDQPK